MADENGNQTENQTPAALPTAEAWNAYMQPFADALDIEVAAATEMLKGVAGEPGERAMAILKNVQISPDADIKAVLPDGTPSGVANQAIALLREVVQVADDTASWFGSSSNLLPEVPDDGSWLAAFKVGGNLKFNKETVIGIVSAGLGNRFGLFDLPKVIADAMEAHAESLDEPAPSEYYDMQTMLTERNYAEVLGAIPGASRKYAAQARKTALLKKVDAELWPVLMSFNEQLDGWMNRWNNGMMNPQAMFAAFARSQRGGGAMPPGMTSPPPTDELRDAAESVVASINRVFAGTGIPVAVALAYDAQQIRKSLENPHLPAYIGAANRDQMLKKLGVAVSSDYPRLEVNLKKFTLGVIELPNIPGGQSEYDYVSELWQLGSAIPWSQLGQMPDVSGGRGRRSRDQMVS